MKPQTKKAAQSKPPKEDDVLRRMLGTPPTPFTPKPKSAPKKAAK